VGERQGDERPGIIDQGVQVAGGTPEFFTNTNLAVANGAPTTKASVGRRAVVVIGAAVVDTLFPGRTPSASASARAHRPPGDRTLERQGGIPLEGNPDNVAAIPISLFARSTDLAARSTSA